MKMQNNNNEMNFQIEFWRKIILSRKSRLQYSIWLAREEVSHNKITIKFCYQTEVSISCCVLSSSSSNQSLIFNSRRTLHLFLNNKKVSFTCQMFRTHTHDKYWIERVCLLLAIKCWKCISSCDQLEDILWHNYVSRLCSFFHSTWPRGNTSSSKSNIERHNLNHVRFKYYFVFIVSMLTLAKIERARMIEGQFSTFHRNSKRIIIQIWFSTNKTHHC
jgi:hypothetical protein